MKHLVFVSALACAILAGNSHIVAQEAVDAESELCEDHTKSESVELMLQGSSGNIYLTPLWEKQLANEDGDQNSWSIALSNGYLYVCVDYYADIAGRKGKLFLRRFDTSKGNEEKITIPLPEDLSNVNHSYPVVFNDESQQLYTAFFLAKENSLILRIYPITIKTLKPEYEYKYGALKEINLGRPQGIVTMQGQDLETAGGKIILDGISDVHGSLLSGDYEFTIAYSLMINQGNYNYYGSVKNGEARSYSLDMTKIDTKYKDKLARHTLAFHPNNKDYFILTAQRLTENYYPVYAMSDVDLVFNQMEPKNPDWDFINCRGVYSFTHQGHPLFVMPVKNTNNMSQFALLSIPDYKTGTASQQALLPQTPFPIQGNMFNEVKQLAITESVDATPSEAPSSRVNLSNQGQCTKLYIYAPGAGVAAYMLGEQSIGTGIETVCSDEPEIRRDGDVIYVSGMESGEAELFRVDGKLAGRFPVRDGKIDLSGVQGGMYLLRIGNTCKKLVL